MASSTGRPLVLVVTGTSGAGKGTLEKILLERMPEVELAVSATTREQRPGEENGREYWFVTPERFAVPKRSDPLTPSVKRETDSDNKLHIQITLPAQPPPRIKASQAPLLTSPEAADPPSLW